MWQCFLSRRYRDFAKLVLPDLIWIALARSSQFFLQLCIVDCRAQYWRAKQPTQNIHNQSGGWERDSPFISQSHLFVKLNKLA